MMRLSKLARGLARKFGFDVIRYEPKCHNLARRKKLFDVHQIDLVLDVGANVGQYGSQLRAIGYEGRIVSFEPLSLAYKELKGKADRDRLWEAHHFALGKLDSQTVIHVSNNSYSSSILDIMPSHTNSAPNSKFVREEKIDVKALDSIYDGVVRNAANLYLKIDTQGFEMNVLEGANGSLAKINTIQVELSLVPLYKGGPLFHEIYQLLYGLGYRLVALEPAFTDVQTGHLLQVDGVFHRI